MPTFSIDTEIRIKIRDYEVEAETEEAAIKQAKEDLKDYYDLDVYGMPHRVETGYDIGSVYASKVEDE